MFFHETEKAATALGIAVVRMEARNPDEIDRAFEHAIGEMPEVRSADDLPSAIEAAARERADVIHVRGEPTILNSSNQARISELASQRRLPLIWARAAAEAGALLSYAAPTTGPAQPQRRAAASVDRILKGARPADLPVLVQTDFEIVFNLRTAQTLGLTLAPAALRQASVLIR